MYISKNFSALHVRGKLFNVFPRGSETTKGELGKGFFNLKFHLKPILNSTCILNKQHTPVQYQPSIFVLMFYSRSLMIHAIPTKIIFSPKSATKTQWKKRNRTGSTKQTTNLQPFFFLTEIKFPGSSGVLSSCH